MTFGTNQHNIPLAAAAALAAILLVAAGGVAGRAPLARVPENSMNFIVCIMLTAFGMFWGAEGAGVRWPGSDAALLVLIPAIGIYALALVGVFRHRSADADPVPTAAVTGPGEPCHDQQASRVRCVLV